MEFNVNKKALASLGDKKLLYVFAEQVIKSRIAQGTRIEAYDAESLHSVDTSGLSNSFSFSHPLVEALDMSFTKHYPLELSPDHIWLTIVQQLALIVSSDPVKFRNKFVDFSGVKTLKVVRNYFQKGSKSNNWEGVFEEFANKIGEYIGKEKQELIQSNFFTTTSISSAATNVALMDCVKSYFKYIVMTLCGIPKIRLLGTVNDWQLLRSKANTLLTELGLDYWLAKLIPVLDEFVFAAQGSPDINFWDSFFKRDNHSGGPTCNGYFNAFFPLTYNYDKTLKINKYFTVSNFDGNHQNNFTGFMSNVPFKWVYYDTTFDMKFMSGFAGIKQNDGLYVSPNMFWAIIDENKSYKTDSKDLEDEVEEQELLAA